MIDLPLNKALAAVEFDIGKFAPRCERCAFYGIDCDASGRHDCCHLIPCHDYQRKDGKNVIFKLVDLPERAGKTHLEAVLDRAKKLGVLDIRLDGNWSINALECMENTLDIIEQDKETLNRNAGEE